MGKFISHFLNFKQATNEKVFDFVKTDNLIRLENQLNLNPKRTCNCQDEFGRTLLMHAVIWGNFEAVKDILNNGADVTKVDKLGNKKAKVPYNLTLFNHICYV